MEHTKASMGGAALTKRARTDLLVMSLIVAIAFTFVATFKDEWVVEWLYNNRGTHFEEFIIALLVAGIGCGVFSARRWSDLQTEVQQRRQLEDSLKSLVREESLIHELSEFLQSCPTASETYRLITDYSENLFPGSSGVIGTIASSRDIVEVVAKWGEPAIQDSSFSPQECWALLRGHIHLSGRNYSSPRCAHLIKDDQTETICIPMMAHGETLGLVYLERPRDMSEGGVESLLPLQKRAVSFSEQVGLSLANLKLREVLRSQSIRDPLTGLFNRRYLEESLQRELYRAARQTRSLSVMMLDVDHFKRFNDMYGHEAGDTLLRELSKTMELQVRKSDIACRYGGEEFALILPDAAIEIARERAEQLRVSIKKVSISYKNHLLPEVTVSIGLSTLSEECGTGLALLRAADQALYRAKEEGRDRVVLAETQQKVAVIVPDSPRGQITQTTAGS